nr:MAG TPA: hypothetical protein [Caudoviricetes sp.]
MKTIIEATTVKWLLVGTDQSNCFQHPFQINN